MDLLSRKAISKTLASDILKGGSSKKKAVNQIAAELLSSHRKNETTLMANDIAVELKKSQGIETAEARSRFPLTEENRQLIISIVRKKSSVKQVEMTELIDESIVGGAYIKTSSYDIDLSIRGKLSSLRKGVE